MDTGLALSKTSTDSSAIRVALRRWMRKHSCDTYSQGSRKVPNLHLTYHELNTLARMVDVLLRGLELNESQEQVVKLVKAECHRTHVDWPPDVRLAESRAKDPRPDNNQPDNFND